MNRLEGKKAVVIGATSGMGEAITRIYAQEGAEVVFTGRREEKGLQIEKEVTEAGGRAYFIQADSTRHEDIERILSFAQDKLGGIDILINNAGVGLTGAIDETDMETYDKIMDINIRSYYDACRLVVPVMKKQGYGCIINTASIGGIKGLAQTSAYCASKGAVRLMTKSLAVELAESGIRVNAICPGTIETDMLAGTSDEYRQMLAAGVPMKRLGKAEDIAYGAVYLGSDEAEYVTGIDLVIDGGIAI